MSNEIDPQGSEPGYATDVKRSDGVLVGAGVQFNLFQRDADSGLKLTWLGLLAAVVVVLLAASSVFAASIALTSTDESLGPPEVLLEPNDLQGANPFMPAPPTVYRPADGMPAIELPSTTGSAAAKPYSGDLAGLYAAPRDQALTDRDEMSAFYSANPEQARRVATALSADSSLAWSGGRQLSGSDLARFLRELTPALLRIDLRVTNYALVEGNSVAHQSILQAGTAVLVDARGVPRFRTLSGSPLTLPAALPHSPVFTGAPWAGFEAKKVGAVSPCATALSRITLIDTATGLPFDRPVGTVGADDADHVQWSSTGTSSPTSNPPAPSTRTPAMTSRPSAPAGPLDLSGVWVLQSSSPTGGGTTILGTMRRTPGGFTFHKEETVSGAFFSWDCSLPDRMGESVTMDCRNSGTIDGKTYATDWGGSGRLVIVPWGAVTKFRFDGTSSPTTAGWEQFTVTIAPQ
ncbi:DUF6777 domain-containing protein [Nocardia sp. NPDC050712]|uniref:DUF6777 domain-containing protein n=1 Tax=Nocardia sp. NPDC050712 TaxID=3155518 RepID=UPI0033C6811D